MQKVPAPIPLHIRSKKPRSLINPPEPSERLLIRVKNNTIRTGPVNANAVIRKATCGMKIEDEKQTRALKNDDLVCFVLETDIRLRRMEPTMPLFGHLHRTIKLIQKLIPQQMILGEVELAPRVPEGIIVSGAREIEPFRVSEFVAREVEVGFAAEGVG